MQNEEPKNSPVPTKPEIKDGLGMAPVSAPDVEKAQKDLEKYRQEQLRKEP